MCSSDLNTRVFNEVKEVGTVLNQLKDVTGTPTKAEVAILFDWENRWAIEGSMGPRNAGMKYVDTVFQQYLPFWKQGIAVDIIDQSFDLSDYKLVITPMMYMVKEGMADKIDHFVKAGGTLVTTYWSGIVDANDLCFLGGFPGPLKDILGIWVEEVDALSDTETNVIAWCDDNALNLQGHSDATHLCDLLHLESARPLATYCQDFYQGTPAVTVNDYGQGQAYYIATAPSPECNTAFYNSLIERLHITKSLDTILPDGVTVTKRHGKDADFIFLMNFNNEEVSVRLDDTPYSDLLTNTPLTTALTLDCFGIKIIKHPHA